MMACGYTSGFMERLPQRQSMASIGRLAVLCIAPVACSEDQTGFDLAPSLGAVERFLPETHRTLADGTTTRSRPKERLDFLIRTFRALGSHHAAVEPAIAGW